MYVIIGASGYLGTYLIKNLLAYTDEKVLAVARRPLSEMTGNGRVAWAVCDIADPESTKAFCERHLNSEIRGGTNKVIYLAAYHHPDLVEKNPRIAWDVNITALSRFLNMAEGVDRFFYPSTESVYGESVDGYRFRECDPLNPSNRYGVHKSCAERLVTAYGYNVVRFPFLIGPSLIPGKKHFYDVIADTVSSGNAINMFQDSFKSALDFDTVAKLVIEIMEKPAAKVPQILNVCGDKALSKYDIGLMIAEKVGASAELIRPVSILEDKEIFSAKRASSTLMDNTLMKKLLCLEKVELKI